MQAKKPLLGITMGDPAGIGPEIVSKALNREEIYAQCCPLVIGDEKAFADAIQFAKLDLKIRLVKEPETAKFEYGTIDLLDLNSPELESITCGSVSVIAGHAAFSAVEKVIQLAMDGRVDATVTAPINKEALNLAGHHFSGHTEIYAKLTGVKDYAMMLVHENFRVVHVSTHVSLREACNRVKDDRVFQVIRLADEACRKMGIATPRIGVAGLNPHAGENGLFGTEELNEIVPAIRRAQSLGMCVEGPLPPDSIFVKTRGGWYDITVAMYHDQGHIPLKMAGFTWNEKEQRWDDISGINITLGLPVIRTSVDHGTAFDLAGKGIASDSSMVQAIRYAIKMANN